MNQINVKQNGILKYFNKINVFFLAFFLKLRHNTFASTIIEKAQPIREQMHDNNDNDVNQFVSTILGYVQFFAMAMAVAGIIFYGIKLVSAQNQKEKGDYKMKMGMIFIGGILLFAGTTVIQIILDAGLDT